MSEAWETFEHAGLTIEFHPDYDSGGPDEWDNLGEMVRGPALDRDYTMGDRAMTSAELDAVERGGCALLVRYLRMTEGAEVVPFSVEDYGSSGQRLYTTDDRAAGFFYADRATIIKEWGDDSPLSRVRTRENFEGQAKTWDTYLQGYVSGYVVRDQSGAVVDSCWGFYPDDCPDEWNEMRSEAQAAAEHEAHERERAANQDVATV